MRRAGGLVLSAAIGGLLGALIVLAVPVPGARVEPEVPRVHSEAVVGEAPVETLLAWTPGRLPDGFAEEAGRLEGVGRVAMVRSGVAWLTAWRDRGGRTQ